MYNPFKPHVVEFEDGTFAVRKFSLMSFAFVYRDATKPRMDYWWYLKSNLCHAKMSTYSEAFSLYSSLKPPVSSYKVKRVLHG